MSDKQTNKQTISKQLAKCPFCNEELEVVGKGHYFAHKINGCILQHLCFETDDEEAIELWNTRKPIESILERLQKKIKPLHNANWNEAFEESIEIVKEEGGIDG